MSNVGWTRFFLSLPPAQRRACYWLSLGLWGESFERATGSSAKRMRQNLLEVYRKMRDRELCHDPCLPSVAVVLGMHAAGLIAVHPDEWGKGGGNRNGDHAMENVGRRDGGV